jgi:hypothetical protein
MPKVLKAYNTDYRIASRPGGEIVLDTGFEEGTVVVTGDLQVKGDTTTVNTTDLEIEDNVIVLNKGELGEGVTEGTSGIEIERGDISNTRWVFDESVEWALGGLNGTGTFYAERVADSQKLPLNTPGIVSPGTLYVDTGNGVISVTGTTNYEESVFNYEAGVIAPAADGSIILDDDHIPNAKGVADFIAFSFANNLQPSIQEGNTKVEAIDDIHTIPEIISLNPLGTSSTVLATANPHGFTQTDVLTISGVNGNGDPIEDLNDTNIQIIEIINRFSFRINKSVEGGDVTAYIPNSGTVQKINAEDTRVQFTVGGIQVSEFFEDRTRIEGVEINGNTISSSIDGENIVLKSPGTGNVQIDDVLQLTAFPWDNDTDLPVPPSEGVRIYTTQNSTTGTFSDQTLGKSGVFFVNSNRTQDELISRNRSLLYSMLF